MQCSTCGSHVRTSDEVVAVICGGCVQRKCAGEELRAEARLGKITAEEFKTARMAAGWDQRMAAVRIRVPLTRLQEFERGRELCPAEIADWMGK